MNVINDAAPNAAAISRRQTWHEPRRRMLLAGGAALAVALGGAFWIAAAPSRVSTDDAYVAADATTVAPKVRGFVGEVAVRDNESVHAGQVLVRIDPEEFHARVAAADAELADAQAGVASARAALVNLDAEERLADANITAARTRIRATGAESDRARADRERYQALVTGGAVARSDADRISAAAVTAEQEAARAQAMLTVANEQASVTRTRRAGLDAALATADARVKKAMAALDLAQQDQRHTTIVASVDGVVGNRHVRVGDYVQPGTALMNIVPLHDLYVTANFKETQTARMLPGQAVSIHVDALGDSIQGRVDSLAPGSGSTFSLLPFEPGTGNFTKIVQRIPVRIAFTPDQQSVAHLRPGLSVTATVRVSP